VTAVHKVNVLKVTEGSFLRETRKVAKEFPEVAYDEQLVDSMAAMLVRDAQRFDVVVTTNMYGDILSDEASELSGSLGLAGAVNASADHCMAQAQHGSAPDIAGQDKANPTSLILSAAMLLEWLSIKHGKDNFAKAHQAIEKALDFVLKDPSSRTPDLGGSLGTKAFTEALCGHIATKSSKARDHAARGDRRRLHRGERHRQHARARPRWRRGARHDAIPRHSFPSRPASCEAGRGCAQEPLDSGGARGRAVARRARLARGAGLPPVRLQVLLHVRFHSRGQHRPGGRGARAAARRRGAWWRARRFRPRGAPCSRAISSSATGCFPSRACATIR
jgi:hypothetical protein